VQLDEEFCEVFLATGIKVGISLDGDRAGNDRHRLYRDGRSSYDQVIRAIAGFGLTGEGEPATGFNVFDNAFTEPAGHPAIQARQLGINLA
jgi:hypothetical protein